MSQDADGSLAVHGTHHLRYPGLEVAELTRFIGREREVEAVRALLLTSRLVTLTGAGGTGKTRLAAEVLRHLSPSLNEGAAWVELASLLDPDSISQQVAEATGSREEVLPGDTGKLIQLLGPNPPLLVLDNCEHLVEACADLAELLLRRSPNLRILATSREALGVKGERAWLVPPLTLPAPDAPMEALEGSEAIRLFVDRAQDSVAGFALTEANAQAVAEICTRLDGIPLAIELAAARVRVLHPGQIRDHLDDAFRLLASGGRTAIPRHRTLRATIDWSHGLLPEEGQILLRRLSVFRGSFTLDSAAVVGAGSGCSHLEEGSILDAVGRLVDRSLVQAVEVDGTIRYSLLETIRQYAAHELDRAGEDGEIRERHAGLMVSEAEAVAPHIFGGRGKPGWLERLDAEVSDLRAAADWAAAHPSRADAAARLGVALQWYWFARGRFREGRDRMEAALAHRELLSGPVRARAQVVLGNLAFWQGDHAAVRGPMESAVTELRGVDDPLWLALALTGLGMAAHVQADPESARNALEEAVAIARTLPLGVPVVFSLYWKALAAQGRGDLALARASLEEGIRIGRLVDDRAAISHPLTVLGRLLLAEGDGEGARRCLAGGLRGHHALGDRWGMALALDAIGHLVLAEGRTELAVELLLAAEVLRQGIDSALPPGEREELEVVLSAARVGLGPAAFHEIEARVRQRRAEDSVALALEALESERVGTPATPPPASPQVPPLPEPSPPPVLMIRTLGTFEVELHGQLLDADAWSYTRPRELLLFLLLHPRGSTRDEIGNALWPESTPPQVKNSFHVTLHHLRKRLGDPGWVLMEGERYRLAPDRSLGWDGGRFREGIEECLRKDAASDSEVERLRALLELYRGDLLEGTAPARWLEEARDHFRRLYVAGRTVLARSLEARSEFEAAAEEYREILRREELNEEAHRGLMASWTRSGHRGRAIRHYQRLEALLREAIDAVPEPATVELHRRILSGEEPASVVA